MGIWLVPAIFTCICILAYGWYSTIVIAKKVQRAKDEKDSSIYPTIERHPLLLNPIIISYVIAGIFVGVIIFYYWATKDY